MGKLKPCPFCMGADVHQQDDEIDNLLSGVIIYRSRVICTECGAAITRTGDDEPESARRNALESWNRRAHGGTKYMEEM